jgi:hypothetical protein
MKKIKIVEIKSLTAKEELIRYGHRKIEIGKCFESDGHMYMQRNNDVLHVNEGIINTLHEGFLNQQSDLIEIEISKFNTNIKKEIYNMELNYFWDSNN